MWLTHGSPREATQAALVERFKHQPPLSRSNIPTHRLARARPDKIMSRTLKTKHRICEPFTRSVDP